MADRTKGHSASCPLAAEEGTKGDGTRGNSGSPVFKPFYFRKGRVPSETRQGHQVSEKECRDHVQDKVDRHGPSQVPGVVNEAGQHEYARVEHPPQNKDLLDDDDHVCCDLLNARHEVQGASTLSGTTRATKGSRGISWIGAALGNRWGARQEQHIDGTMSES